MTMLEIWQVYGWPLLWVILKVLFIALPVLIPVAYASYYQRKIMAVMQLRRGPNVVGPWGLLQPAADGLKLILKEWIIPYAVDKPTFLLAPLLSLVLMFIAWAVIPFSETLVLADINMGVLYIMAISAVDVYAILIAGWASRSRYAFLGGLRSSAQMISYEVSMGLIICCILLLTHSLNLNEIVKSQKDTWYIIVLFPIAIIFFISILAETSRHPFDLPEAESELVAGYNVEYSGVLFAMFQMAEYGNTFVMSSFFTVLFLGGWLPPIDILPFNMIPGIVWFIVKVMFVVFVIYWIQATLPRYRYDQLMRLGWKVFLPLTLLAFILLAFILRYS